MLVSLPNNLVGMVDRTHVSDEAAATDYRPSPADLLPVGALALLAATRLPMHGVVSCLAVRRPVCAVGGRNVTHIAEAVGTALGFATSKLDDRTVLTRVRKVSECNGACVTQVLQLAIGRGPHVSASAS